MSAPDDTRALIDAARAFADVLPNGDTPSGTWKDARVELLNRCDAFDYPEEAMGDYPEASDRLVAFLYLLCRDHLPSGKVRSLVDQVTLIEDGAASFTAPELEALARRYAGELS